MLHPKGKRTSISLAKPWSLCQRSDIRSISWYKKKLLIEFATYQGSDSRSWNEECQNLGAEKKQ
jgi:hypothetical protein